MNTDPAPRHTGCARCACQSLCLLGKMNTVTRQSWQDLTTERSFAKGDMLLRQGETASFFRIVKVGTTMLLRSAEDGVERPVGMCGHGQTLGSTVLLGQPATFSCLALSPVRVCEVPIAPLLHSGLVDQAFLWELAVSYAQTNAHLADWARIVRIRTVAGQVAGTLLQLAALQRSTLVRLPSQSALAALLAIFILVKIGNWYKRQLALAARRPAVAADTTGPGLSKRKIRNALIILGVLVFPNFVALWGANAALWFFAVIGLAGLVICIALAPETLHRSLEELDPTSVKAAKNA